MPFYGFLKFSECYHISASCPVLQHVKKRVPIEIRKYDKEESAYNGGHLRRCKLCLGEKVFDAKDKNLVRLTKAQFQTMEQLVGIYKETGKSVTLRQLADRRGKSIVSTHLMLQRLIDRGLAKHEYSMGSRKAKNGSIAPTDKGIKIMHLEELD